MKRIFIAVDINKSRPFTRLVESYKQLLKNEKIRWVQADNIHLTLAFLGNKDEEQVNRVGDIMCEVVKNYEPFEISFNVTGVFRDIRKPRVIWLGIKAPQLLYEMQGMICDKLKKEGLYEEDKPFKPHLTIGRMKYIVEREILSAIVESAEAYNLPPQPVNELILYESITKPEGPVYYPLRKARLKNPGQ
ncbi:MAG: RNA 2',3'-cyclic phosphodiesterase [Bacteroidota bacterium]|nr:RNA 2',3'-cyclic phosphodiesterase [Bacteroidota bacterium]